MKIAIMQPTFNPWIGYFDLINSVDTFVFLDHVQLNRRSWQTRNKIKVNNTEHMITIPLKKEKHRDEEYLHTMQISDFSWVKKTLKTIEFNYKKASHFDEVFPFIQTTLMSHITSLPQYNIHLIKKICEKLQFNQIFIDSSTLKVSGTKDNMLLIINQKLQSTAYLSPQGSKEYLIESNAGDRFKEKGIDLIYHHYTHPIYKQLGTSFIPYLGVFDILLNHGFEETSHIIKSGHNEDIPYARIHQ